LISTQFAGWKAGPFAWHATPLRDALKQETFAIPPLRSSPWQEVQALPSGSANALCVSMKLAGWLPLASTRLPVDVPDEHPAARKAAKSSAKIQGLPGCVAVIASPSISIPQRWFPRPPCYLWHAMHFALFLLPWQWKHEPGSILPSSWCWMM
jgi:hypothetical protein